MHAQNIDGLIFKVRFRNVEKMCLYFRENPEKNLLFFSKITTCDSDSPLKVENKIQIPPKVCPPPKKKIGSP